MSVPQLVTRRAPLPAASFNRETRTFSAIAATGSPVPRFDWEAGRTVNEVLVVTPAAIDLTRLGSGRAPILNGHRAGSASDQVGVIRGARIEAGQLIIDGELSGRAELASLADDVAAGVISNVSVGYRVLARERVPGAPGQHDTIKVTRWQPVEVSIVPVPADPAAFVRSGVVMDPEDLDVLSDASLTAPPAAPPVAKPPSRETRAERTRVATLTDFARRGNLSAEELDAAIENGTSAKEFGRYILDQQAERCAATRTSSISPMFPSEDTRTSRAIEGALYARMTGKAPEGQAREFMGRSLLEMGVAVLEARGERVRWSDRDQLAGQIMSRAGDHTTSDFPGLLTSASNRVLAEAYQLALSPLKTLARSRTRTDFRPVSAMHLSEAPRLLKVGESGEVKHGSRAEEGRPLYQLNTYARIFGLSRNALINDDLHAFADALSAFGEGAAQTENDELAALFTANGGAGAAIYDGKPLYHASHGNLGTGGLGTIGVDELGMGRRALREMKSLDGRPLNIVPKHLVVSPAGETQAEQVLTELYATQAQDANPFPGKLTLHVEPRFSGMNWRLFADPSQLPCIEISYLAGREGPQLSFREGWDTLGIEYRAVLDFGCGIRDYRGTYLSSLDAG